MGTAMKTSSKLLSFLLFFTITVGCSQNNPVNKTSKEKNLLDLPEITVSGSIDNATSSTIATNWTGSVIYDFDDLTLDCSWNNVFPNIYKDLIFSGINHISRCGVPINAIPGIENIALLPADIGLYYSGNLGKIRIELPKPATKVRIYSANLIQQNVRKGFYSYLVSYDANGDQIDLDSNTEFYYDRDTGYSSVLLTVGENDDIPIYSIDLMSYQAVTYYDNLEILYRPIDTTPPEILYNQNEISLWPANHKMVLAVSDITALDDYDENPAVSVKVSSNEPDNVGGSGNTDKDWKIVMNTEGTYDVYLRAERSGKGSGRTYTVTISAEDETGNKSEEKLEVIVAHDLGKS